MAGILFLFLVFVACVVAFVVWRKPPKPPGGGPWRNWRRPRPKGPTSPKPLPTGWYVPDYVPQWVVDAVGKVHIPKWKPKPPEDKEPAILPRGPHATRR